MSLELPRKRWGDRQRYLIKLTAAVGEAARVTGSAKGDRGASGRQVQGACPLGGGPSGQPTGYGWSPGSNWIPGGQGQKWLHTAHLPPALSSSVSPHRSQPSAPARSGLPVTWPACAVCALMLFLDGHRELALPRPSTSTLVPSPLPWPLLPSGL